MTSPVVVTSIGRGRALATDVLDGLADTGLPVSRRRVGTGGGDWLVSDGRMVRGHRPELVICPDEDARETVETQRPDLVGDVWVWQPDLPGLLRRRYRPTSPAGGARIGVVGYNLKFFRPIEQHLRRLAGVELRVAEWPKFAVESTDTDEVLEWATVVFCEWAGRNAAIASRRRRPEQRLLVRLHRFELERDDWRDIDIDRVDAVVAVGEPYRRRILEVTGWPEERVIVVPNSVDVAQLDRPKLEEAERAIGLLGATPWRKRPDRALEVLERLRERNAGWRLRIKGARPDAERWMRHDEYQTARYEELDGRLDVLGEAVTWDPPGPDVAAWFRRVGCILSTSEDESFHLAPAEGMVSGTVPVIWPWFGADEIYGRSWIIGSTEEAAEAVTGSGHPEREAARKQAEQWKRDSILADWERLLLPSP